MSLIESSHPDAVPVVLVIGQLELGGGAEGQITELALGLREEGFRPVVISLRAGPPDGRSNTKNYWADYLRARGIRVHELKRAGRLDLGRLRPLAALLKHESAPIVQSQMFAANAYARVAAFLSGGRPILIAAERTGRLPMGVQRLVDRCLQPFTDGIIANAEAIRRMLLARGTRVPIWVVPNGIDTNRYTPERRAEARAALGIPPQAPLVGIVARMSAEKNYPLFLRVVRKARESIAGLRAIAVGDGPLRRDIEKEVRQLGLDGTLTLLGKVSNVQELLPALDVFLLTSVYEGLSNAIMEAQASGVPAVVTDVGGNAEVVRDGDTGFVVRPDDETLFTRRVVAILADPDLRSRMARAARRRMETHFSMKTMVRSTAAVYRELLRARSARS